MTVKLVVLYTLPEDKAGFDEYYLGVHMPLVAEIPGLQRAETSVFSVALDGGEHTYHRMAELYFADQAALEAALGTPQSAATAADFRQIAPPGSRMFIATVD